jgi:ribonucleoside-diphosphate reductase alpha chain
VRIKKITKSLKLSITGDIQVANTNSYQLKNGVVSHNSVVLMTESGIHPAHSLMHFRIMQLNKNSDTAKFLEQEMPFLLEESVWSKNNTDYVVFVPIVNPENGLFKKDMKGVKHLELIKLVQNNWIVPGTNRELGICNLTNHNCSCTVIIDDSKSITDYIWNNRKDFTAVSFISDYGDKDFNQAPFTSVMTFEEIASAYGKGSMFASGLIVDGLHYFNNNLWNACDCLLDKSIPVTGTREQVLLKKDWIRRAKQFAKNYFKNDIRKMIYCLKDVHLFHKWESINRQMKEISLETVLNKPSYKDVSDYAAVACSGGSCEITRLN